MGGVGATFHYDAIGNFERCPYTTSGSGSSLVMGVLDTQLDKGNQTIDTPSMNKEQLIELAQDVMSSVAERDIHTGDYGEIFLIDAGGVHEASGTGKFNLRLD